MDVSAIGKASSASPAWTDMARMTRTAVADAVRTESPPAVVVTQTSDRPAVGGDTRRDPPRAETNGSDALSSRVVIDTDARQLVFQSVDTFTGQVVEQTPDKAIMRQRAYVVQAEDAKFAEALAGDAATRVRRVV